MHGIIFIYQGCAGNILVDYIKRLYKIEVIEVPLVDFELEPEKSISDFINDDSNIKNISVLLTIILCSNFSRKSYKVVKKYSPIVWLCPSKGNEKIPNPKVQIKYIAQNGWNVFRQVLKSNLDIFFEQ